MNRNQYTTDCGKKERVKTSVAVLCLVAVIIAGAVGLIIERQPTPWDVEYRMTNQHIRWEGAGYDGIREGN